MPQLVAQPKAQLRHKAALALVTIQVWGIAGLPGDQVQTLSGPGHSDIEQTAFAFDVGLEIVFLAGAVGQEFFLQPRDDDLLPLESLGAMDGGQQDASLLTLAGLGFQGLEVGECLAGSDIQSGQVTLESVDGFDPFIGGFVGQGQPANALEQLGVFGIAVNRCGDGPLEASQLHQHFPQRP